MKKTTFIADGKIKKFSFDFPFFLKSNVVVTVNDAPATNYNMVCVSNGMNANIPFSGGYVIFTRAPKYGDVVTISRSLPLDRVVDYQPTVEINPTAINQDFNYLIEILKDLVAICDCILDAPSESKNKEEIDTVQGQIKLLLTDMEKMNEHITAVGDGESGGESGAPTVDLTDIRTSIAQLSARCNELAAMIENIDISGGSTLPDDIDYVTEWQNPTAENNYTWYRKYASGWVEQGGTTTAVTLSFPVQFENNFYSIVATSSMIEANVGTISVCYSSKTPTGVTVQLRWNGAGITREYNWFAAGY